MDAVTYALAISKFKKLGRFGWNERLASSLLGTPDCRFLLPMQEMVGDTANDLSGNQKHALYEGQTVLGKLGPNHRIDSLVGFNGVDTRISIPKDCSVAGLSAVTFIFVAELIGDGLSTLWFESGSGQDTVSKLEIRFSELKVQLRTRTGNSVAFHPFVTLESTDLEPGIAIFHFVSNPATDTLRIYRNSELVAENTQAGLTDRAYQTGTPVAGPFVGYSVNSGYYTGNMSYVASFTRELTTEEITTHARAAGVV